jgi:iron complex outermembrane receptor protein
MLPPVPAIGTYPRLKARRFKSFVPLPSVLAGCCAALAVGVTHAQPLQDYPGTGDAGAQLEEIVVTARHREEAAERVPIALSSLTATELSATRTVNLTDLAPLVPSMQLIQFNPRNTNLTIRGLGSNVAIANDGLETGVGIYIDGVYYARPGEAMFDMFDLERIEVLRGPQGTLFGRNTTAGAVTIYSAAPTFTPQASAEVSVGDYGYYQLRGVVSGPIVDGKLAGRLSVYGTSRDGFVRNVVTGQTLQDYGDDGARAQLLFNPDDVLTVRVIGDYGYQEENCCINVPAGVATRLANGQPFPDGFYSRASRIGYVPLPIDPKARLTDVDSPIHAKAEQGGISIEADWALDETVLTGISSYRYWNWYPHNDFDDIGAPILTAADTPSRERQASQELRFTSPADRTVQYTGGLYYFHEDVQSSPLVQYGADAAGWILPPGVPLALGNLALDGFANAGHEAVTTNSYAAYAQATWHIDDRWSLTGGLRYTFDDKSGVFAQQQQGGVPLSALPPAARGPVSTIRNTLSEPNAYSTGLDQGGVSGTASISYQIDDETLAYASYARGVKSGGLNLAALPPGVSSTLKPESIDDYELGLKTTLLDRRVSLNAALYWAQDSNYQSLYANPALVTSYIANVGEVRSRGVEIDLRASPLEGLSLTLSSAYDDASYVSYPMGPCPLEQLNEMVCNLAGRPLPGAPRWATSLAAEYVRPAGELFAFAVNTYVGGQYSYRSSFFTGVNDSVYARVPGYSLLDLRAGLRADDDVWDLSFWVRNAADTFYYATLGPVALNSGLIAGTLGAPRTMGGTFKVKF